MEFEDPPTLGHRHRVVEIDTVDDADKPDTERNAARERTEGVAEVPDALRRVQLGRTDFFRPAPHSDDRAASSAQVAHPLDLAPGGPDPPPASYLNNRQRRGARQAAFPTANSDESVEA